jgi:hypothetical protein
LFEKLAQLAPGAISSRGGALENFTSDVERLRIGRSGFSRHYYKPFLLSFQA